MKKLKALTIFIFLLGVFCSLFGVFMLFSLESNLKLSEELRQTGVKGAQEIKVTRLRAGIISHAIWFGIIGLLSIVSSVGIFRMKEWARKLWLGVLILLAGISLYWFASAYLQGPFRVEDLIGYPIIGVVIIAMWLYFTRQKIKDHFRRSDV